MKCLSLFSGKLGDNLHGMLKPIFWEIKGQFARNVKAYFLGNLGKYSKMQAESFTQHAKQA